MPSPPPRTRRLLSELKRRRVYHVATAYAAAAIVLLEGADLILPVLPLPGWTYSVLVVLVLVGFPVAVALSWVYEITEEGVRRTEAVTDGEGAPEPAPWSSLPTRYKAVRLAVAALIVGGAVWLGRALWPDTALAFTEGDWILIADFENATGNPLFDECLDTAFRIALQQSPHLNVLPRRRVEATLRRMRADPSMPVTEAIGQEVAQREGVGALVVPAITGVGGQYRLGMTIQDPATGKALRTEVIRLEGEDRVLSGLDDLAERVRTFLGESPASLTRHQRQLTSATTRSLEALKQYTLANEHLRQGEWERARQGFELALQIDSAFTAARASLGILEFERFDREAGARKVAEAAEDIEGLTEQEAYGIRAFYADAVEHDLEKAAGIHEALIKLYPSAPTPHNNLGWVRARQGRYDEAAAEYRVALRLDPTLELTYSGLSWIYLHDMGQLDSVMALARRRVQTDDTSPMPWSHIGWAYLGMDSVEAAVNAFEKALELNPRYAPALYRAAHAHRLAGRYDRAVDYLTQALQVDSATVQTHYHLGVVHQMAGDRSEAERHFAKYRSILEEGVRIDPAYAYSHLELALIAARMGDTASAVEHRRMAVGIDSTSADALFGLAQLAAVEGRRDQALTHVRRLLDAGFTDYVWLEVHPDFEPMREDPDFRRLIDGRLSR